MSCHKSQYSLLQHFAMAMFMGKWRESITAVFTIYLDESGSPDDTKAVVVAGLLAEAEQWIDFERNWKDALQHFGVSALHMKHYAHSVGDFRDWKGDEEKRRRFLARLINIVTTRVRHTFADAVLMDDYRKVDETYYLKDTFTPYTIAARTCVAKVRRWATRYSVNEKDIAYLFEDGANDKGDLVRRLKADQISNYGFIPKAASVALQAADLLAYEHLLVNSRLCTGEIQSWDETRHPFRELDKIPNDEGRDWGTYTIKDLEEFCVNVKIPRRPVAPTPA